MKQEVVVRTADAPVATGLSRQVSLLAFIRDTQLADRSADVLSAAGFLPGIDIVTSLDEVRKAVEDKFYDLALGETKGTVWRELQTELRSYRIPLVLFADTPELSDASDLWASGVLELLSSADLDRLPGLARLAVGLRELREDAWRADEALRQSERRFRTLVEKSSDAISLVNAEGKVFYSSHAVSPIFGYTLEERIGKNVFELVHPEDIPRTVPLFQGLLKTPFGSAFTELRYRHKNGSWRWIEALGTNLLEDPAVRAVVINYRDITDRRNLQEQLFQAQKMEAVGRLAGGVAHDFNNLLTAILGYSDMVLEKLPRSAPPRRYIAEIRKAGERAAGLTRQLLAFSRLQVLAPQVLDLNSVISEMSKMLRRVIGEDITLVTPLGAVQGHVKADPSQIEQVILNLAVNARDAMPNGGQLTLATSNISLEENLTFQGVRVNPGPYVLLEVSDTGCGMDAATRARAFEPFFTTKEKGKGTGLGLSTVYGIVKQSGGYIWLYSEPGCGTTFKIYLPRVDDPLPAGKLSESAARKHQGNETILLVEDENSVRALIRQVLRAKGYEVVEARDGAQALEISRNSNRTFHLMLTDVVMPQMNGPELARRMSALQPGMKVLYMTGYAGNTVGGAEVLERGAEYIQKPFAADALAHKIRTILDQK